MKLYTEEQVKQVIANLNTERFVSTDELLEELKLTPIELPSDEEIKDYASKYAADGAIMLGAKWMKQQSLNQNK